MTSYAPDVQPLTTEQEAIAELAKPPTEAVTEHLTAFRAQVKPGQGLPYFVLRSGSGADGACPSCGEPWMMGGRCLSCKAAALVVVEEMLAGKLARASVPSSP